MLSPANVQRIVPSIWCPRTCEKKYHCSLFNAFHRSQARYIQLDSWTVELNHFQCTGENSNTIPSPNEQNDSFIFIYLSKLFNLQWLWEAVFTRSICVLTHKMYTLVNFFVRYLNVKWGFNFFMDHLHFWWSHIGSFSLFNHVSNSLLQQTFHPIANHIIVEPFTNKSVILESYHGISASSVID